MSCPARFLTTWSLLILFTCAWPVVPSAADDVAQRPPWAGASCDRAWDYQGELPRRSVPDSVWETLSSEPLDGVLDANLVQRLAGALDSLLVLTKAPAIGVAVGIPGEGTWSDAVGVSRTRPPEPLPDTALFHAGSAGKAFTATLVMQLIEERHLDLGTSVLSWFTEFPNARWITIDHLLAHSGGVYSFTDHKRYQKGRGFEPPSKLIEFAARAEPRFCPGAQWSYSNTGYVMLGRIIERLRGRSLQEMIDRNIVERLDLQNTVARFDRDDVAGHVVGHLEGKPLKKVSYALPHGAGIVSTTPEDLVRFWHGLLTGRLVSPSSVRTMCTDMFPVFGEEETHYGRGIMTYDVPGSGLIIGYGGRINGFRSVVGYLVDDGVYVTVLANDDAPVEAALHVLVRTVRAWRSRKG